MNTYVTKRKQKVKNPLSGWGSLGDQRPRDPSHQGGFQIADMIWNDNAFLISSAMFLTFWDTYSSESVAKAENLYI
jgi:hypothetical protein